MLGSVSHVNSRARDNRIGRLEYSAKKAFARRGYYATSISEIVHDAGIARGTFYQYFDNKLHIFQSILDSFVQSLRGCIRPVGLGAADPPPLTQIQENLARVLNLVLAERDLTQILLHHSSTPGQALQTRLDDFYQQVSEMIERSLRLGITMNLVRPCNARLTTYSIIGAVKEVVLQLTASRETQPPVEGLVQDLLDFGMKGILSESQASRLETAQRSRIGELSQGPSGGSRVVSVPST